MDRAGRGQLAHLFSLLPKIGMHESELLDEHIAHCVADAVRDGGPDAEVKLAEASAAIARLVRS